MINIFRENFKKILISLITNPILIILYWAFCYELSSLCMYGRMNNNIYIFFICLLLIICIVLFTIFKVTKNKYYKYSKTIKFKYIFIIIILTITSFYGVKIYKSSVNYGGKLSWVIERLKSERKVKFENNNIYEDGVGGIFKDINKKYKFPKELYMSDNFSLKFKPDGTITSFDTFIYGKDDKGKEKSYLISYDKNKSKDITLILNGYADPKYNYDKLLNPLIETVKVIPVKETVDKWNQDSYGLVYYGKRNWGYNSDGIVNINEKGELSGIDQTDSKIVGYTVSLFTPGNEGITPARYNLVNNSSWSKSCLLPQPEDYEQESGGKDKSKEEFYLTKEVGYKANLVDKALGSSLYSLSKTTDSGKIWEVINEDPFNGTIGSVGGIKFINDNIGFITTIRPSGTEGSLYRTDDGGVSFKLVEYPIQEVTLDNGGVIKPFDMPGIPYEKDGVLYMSIGQGPDGDYKGNTEALYKSKNQGETWEFINLH